MADDEGAETDPTDLADAAVAALADVANELYALTPEEFTAARNARSKQLRGDGDRDLAKAVAELRRPSATAWLVNRLAALRADELDELLELGSQLRAAQAEVDAATLIALGRERRKVVSAMAKQAGALAEGLGHAVRAPVLDDVTATLQAAMTDAAAADAVRTGRLVRGLEAIGTDVDLTDAVAAWSAADLVDPPTGAGRAAPHDELAERRTRKQQQAAEAAVHRAEQAEEEALAEERAVAAASDRLDDADGVVEAATADRDAVRAEAERLERRLADAERALAEAQHAADERRRERDRATTAAEQARATADALRDALDRS